MATWTEITSRNPQHSHNYAQRWDRLEAEGKDIVGEARLIDALASREARILDAGCGQGRIGGYLSERGHEVTGVDLDPLLISIAAERHPDATWLVADLTNPLPCEGPFDLAVCAGNVITFVAADQRQDALEHIRQVMAPGGRVVIGFGVQRGYPFPAFFEHAQAAGFAVEQRFASWDLEPFNAESPFVVAILRKAQ